ncbi:MAG TPA: alkaline phosphatase D family protein [Thermoleophilaceae bacterium]|nr:alkaline phosphatase D family protein [Thermoleophilaceae bacterium]
MAELLVGPLLRFVSETQATIWVEVDSPCEVNVLGASAPTFHVEGHHYALVVVDGLTPGTTYEYDVRLDGRRVWPEEESDWPAPCLRTFPGGDDVTIVFGSCRVAVPHEPPYTLTKDEDREHGREIDALYALAHRLRDLPREDWPDLLLMIGDQVYVDEDAPKTREFIRSRRDTSRAPYEEVLDFEEYTHLYRETWNEDVIRWLLSTVPTAMLFDDHDTHDDWNISEAWCRDMERQPWWRERIESALVSYWIYQHIGNLSPAEIERRGLLAEVQAADDAGPLLRRHARKADRDDGGSIWSYARELGHARLVMFDSREGRVFRPRREMNDDEEWAWIEQHATGGVDHLLLVDTLPMLMSPAFHYAEAWNEAVCAGAWGKRLARFGEKLRRAFDMEHWAAFQFSFKRMQGLLQSIARGERGEAPATIVMVGGDIHHAYLAAAEVPGAKSKVWQAVCSPFRNPLDKHERTMARLGSTKPAERVARWIARRAGVEDPAIKWELVQTPTFDNQFATIELNGRRAKMKIEKTVPGNWQKPKIDITLERELA